MSQPGVGWILKFLLSVFFVISFGALALCPARAEFRVWTDLKGNSLEAEYMRQSDGEVVIRDRNGKVYRFDPVGLSEEDQRYLQLLRPPEMKIEAHCYSEAVNGSDEGNELSANRAVRKKYSFKGTITLEEDRPYHNELKVEVYTVARNPRGRHYLKGYSSTLVQFADRESSSLSWAVDPVILESQLLTNYCHCGKCICQRGVWGGYRYSGYLAVVRDLRGEVLAVSSNHSIFENKWEKIASAKVGQYLKGVEK